MIFCFTILYFYLFNMSTPQKRVYYWFTKCGDNKARFVHYDAKTQTNISCYMKVEINKNNKLVGYKIIKADKQTNDDFRTRYITAEDENADSKENATYVKGVSITGRVQRIDTCIIDHTFKKYWDNYYVNSKWV